MSIHQFSDSGPPVFRVYEPCLWTLSSWNGENGPSQGPGKQKAEKNPAYVWAATSIRSLDPIFRAVEDTGHTRFRPIHQRYRRIISPFNLYVFKFISRL